MAAPGFARYDVVRGYTSGATATIWHEPVLISGSDAANDSIYTCVSPNVVGTFVVGELLYVNDVLTDNTISAAVTDGCVGPNPATL